MSCHFGYQDLCLPINTELVVFVRHTVNQTS